MDQIEILPNEHSIISQIKRSLGATDALLHFNTVIAAASLHRGKL